MHGFETVLALLVGVTFLALLARRLDIPTPAVLVAGGLLVALVPGLPAVQFEPQLVFLVFTPPLLYRASLLASYRDVRAAVYATRSRAQRWLPPEPRGGLTRVLQRHGLGRCVVW